MRVRRVRAIFVAGVLALTFCSEPPTAGETGEGTLVTAAGGSFGFLDGALMVDVPSGAMNGQLRLVAAMESALPLDPAAVNGLGYRLTATPDVQLSLPATITMKYDEAKAPFGVPESQLGAHRVSGSSWVHIPDAGTVDEVANTVAAEVSSFGTFGIKRVPPAAGCTAPEHRQFDFWLGEWRVNPGAESSITAEPGGCAIFEDYRPTGGTGGRSISVYDPGTGLWYQTFLSGNNPLQPLRMSGGLDGDDMVMYVRVAGQLSQRWTWKMLAGGSVVQSTESSSDNGSSWTPGFVGTYTRK
jgi:hypothetical protein